jgi:DNA-binding winged helix-turn-helix (wHTH) protein
LYEFDRFRLDPHEGVLLSDGRRVRLEPKDLEILLVLVENHGHTVGKEELFERIWPGTFVEEGNLARHISVLRQVLGQAQSGAQYIETVPKRGYRFVAPVRQVDPFPAEVQPKGTAGPLPILRPVGLRGVALAGAVVLWRPERQY